MFKKSVKQHISNRGKNQMLSTSCSMFVLHFMEQGVSVTIKVFNNFFIVSNTLGKNASSSDKTLRTGGLSAVYSWMSFAVDLVTESRFCLEPSRAAF